MSDKKRICETCAWWDAAPYENLANDYGICCFDNNDNAKHKASFCRHHSFTRGWTKDIPEPGDIRHDHLVATTPDQVELLNQLNNALEVYNRLLDDWYLMKDK